MKDEKTGKRREERVEIYGRWSGGLKFPFLMIQNFFIVIIAGNLTITKQLVNCGRRLKVFASALLGKN